LFGLSEVTIALASKFPLVVSFPGMGWHLLELVPMDGWKNAPMELFPQVQLLMTVKLLICIVYILDTNACGECCVDDYVLTMELQVWSGH
jgi:hypothetical protein